MRLAGGKPSDRNRLLLLALLTFAAGVAENAVGALQPRSLLPWVGLFTVAVAATFRRPRAVDLFEPFTFLSWTHFAPAYVVGAFLLAVGVVEYPYPGLVTDPVTVCALSLLYLVIGYFALGLGCRSRAAESLGRRLASWLPAPREHRTVPITAILLLVAMGLAASYGAFRSGIIGYAIPRPAGPLDAAAAYAATFMSVGHFLFWFRWFDRSQKPLPRLTLALPILIVGLSMVLWGNRGMVLSCYLLAALAFRFARGRLSLPQGSLIVALAFVALAVGMVYGSVFRRLQGGETGSQSASAALAVPPVASPGSTGAPAPPEFQPPRPSMERQFSAAAETMASLVQKPRSAGIQGILAGVGQRLNLLSDVSVTIARYRELRPLEASHGVVGIWTMTWTGFVPRAIWPTKPRVSDARAYAALYFGWGGNSCATTPTADLIRNGGPLVMPLGMALLGLVLGALHAAFATGNPVSPGGRAAFYSMLLLSINLEGPYGMILPTLLRVGFVALLGLGIVRLWRLPPDSQSANRKAAPRPEGLAP